MATPDQSDKRQYKRLDAKLSVRFTIVRLQGDLPGVDWQKGFTRNVSEAGLCLETKDLSRPTIEFLTKERIYLDLRIHLPLAPKRIKAVAEIAWSEHQDDAPGHYIIGLKYRSIVQEDLHIILKFAGLLSPLTELASKVKRMLR